MAILEAKNIFHTFPPKTVLHDISFSIQEGEFILLTGANGCGKTTFLKILAGLIRPTKGKVAVNAKLLSAALEENFLYQKLTVEENFKLFAALYNLEDDAFSHISEEFELEDMWKEPVFSLSKGQLQNVKIARSFLAPAPLFLLDEPFVSLDEEKKENIKTILRKKKEKGVAMLIVTHESDLVLPLVDKHIALKNGVIEEQ